MPAADGWAQQLGGPLFWLMLTLLVYELAVLLYQRLRQHPLANPVALAVLVLIGILLASGTSYATYFAAVQPIHLLLGPATVALALPLYEQAHRLRRLLLPLGLGLLAGSLAGALTAVGIAALLGGSAPTLASLAPKSVTTPIAMGIAERIGGIPSLTAALVIFTGILGAMFALPLLQRLRIDDHAVIGFAMGVSAHGVGTARALQLSEQAGAFAALAMGLNGAFTALWLPVALALWR